MTMTMTDHGRPAGAFLPAGPLPLPAEALAPPAPPAPAGETPVPPAGDPYRLGPIALPPLVMPDHLMPPMARLAELLAMLAADASRVPADASPDWRPVLPALGTRLVGSSVVFDGEGGHARLEFRAGPARPRPTPPPAPDAGEAAQAVRAGLDGSSAWARFQDVRQRLQSTRREIAEAELGITEASVAGQRAALTLAGSALGEALARAHADEAQQRSRLNAARQAEAVLQAQHDQARREAAAEVERRARRAWDTLATRPRPAEEVLADIARLPGLAELLDELALVHHAPSASASFVGQVVHAVLAE